MCRTTSLSCCEPCHCLRDIIFFLFFGFFPYRVYICSFGACPGTHPVDQADLELTEICLPQPPECWDQRCAPPLPGLEHHNLYFYLLLNCSKTHWWFQSTYVAHLEWVCHAVSKYLENKVGSRSLQAAVGPVFQIWPLFILNQCRGHYWPCHLLS